MLRRIAQLTLLNLIVHCSVIGLDFRTPLEALFLPAHYPFPFEYETMPWKITVEGIGYHRQAYEAFTDHVSTSTVNYSSLYFGKQDFLASEAFYENTVQVGTNPWLNLSIMSPRVSYHENGVMFGIDFSIQPCNDSSYTGLRAKFPMRYIEIKRRRNGRPADDELGAGNIDAYVAYKPEQFADARGIVRDTVSFAYRLDFLSSLAFNSATSGTTIPFIRYNDPLFNNNISIAGQRAFDQGTNPISYPLFVVDSNNGAPPTGQFGQYSNNTILVGLGQEPTPLANNGTNLANGAHGFFSRTGNYSALGNSPSAQAQLWVVPAIDQLAAAIAPTIQSDNLRQAMIELLELLDTSAEEFFNQQGIFFGDAYVEGLGDLLLEYYQSKMHVCSLGYEWSVGIQIPSGRHLKHPNQLFAQPVGCDGHYQLMASAKLFWQPIDWFTMRTDVSYWWALSHHEKINASFQGATVKNLGPVVIADVSWSYLVGHIDATFVHCDEYPYGLNIGYELFARTSDKIRFVNMEIKDLLGIVRPLDNKVAQLKSNGLVNKIRTEFFMQHKQFELFAGWIYAVAGRNAPKETDWYFGIQVGF